MPENALLEPSILVSTKKFLNIPDGYTEYDMDILLHINSVLTDVHDLGIGPANFFITSSADEWDDFLRGETEYGSVKSLVFLKVRLLFDLPQNGVAVTAIENQIKEMMTRLHMRREAKEWTDPNTGERISQETILDGGSI